MNNDERIDEYGFALNGNSNLPDNSDFEMVLPRRGWQDKQALLKVIMKAKRALDIAEISHLLD